MDNREEKITKNIVIALSFGKRYPLVLDENRLELYEPLRELGFKVIRQTPGDSDDRVKELAERGSAIVTQNTNDFIDDAVQYDYDIVSLDKLSFLDGLQSKKNKTAVQIKKALRESNLSQRKGNFVLTLYNNGKWKLKELSV